MLRTVVALAALAAAALISTPAEAQWKWKDKTGHTQYSDLPPPLGTPEQDILSRPGALRNRVSTIAAPASAASSADAPALAPKTVDSELEARRKADLASKLKADEDRVAAAKADNCSRAKTQVKTFESGIRLARTNDKGEREFLDDGQRAQELKRAKEIVASDCK